MVSSKIKKDCRVFLAVITCKTQGKVSEFNEKWLKDSTIHKERATGIEPVIKAWEAFVLPLNYARIMKLSEKDYSILSISCQEKQQ
jgi:hypothetical protein